MVDFKVVINDTKNGKSHQIEVTGHHANSLIGKNFLHFRFFDIILSHSQLTQLTFQRINDQQGGLSYYWRFQADSRLLLRPPNLWLKPGFDVYIQFTDINVGAIQVV